jgi:hypothetical protein
MKKASYSKTLRNKGTYTQEARLLHQFTKGKQYPIQPNGAKKATWLINHYRQVNN